MNDYRALLALVRPYWLVVVAGVMLGVLVGGSVALLMPADFTTHSRVFIATPNWNDSTADAQPGTEDTQTSYGDEFTQQRMSSYLEVLTSPLVLQPVANKLGVPVSDLQGRVTGRLVPDTVIVEITAHGSSPAEAMQIANAVAAQYTDTVAKIEKPSFRKASPVQPIVISPAVEPSASTTPDVGVYLICGAVSGFLIGLAGAAALGTRRTTKSSNTPERTNTEPSENEKVTV
ncbi:YveK family protein [Gordonia jacobaea]|uniref:YveK family protein n=1 Tax=Gordonia jacobaea TaxID=122202 RepID=UPI003D76086A